MLHKDVVLADRHPTHSWEVADPAALAALVVTSADVGKVAKQLSPLRFFMLANNTGPVWFEASWSTTLAASIQSYVDTEISDLTAAVAAAFQPLDTQLTDFAALSYASNALKVLRVNSGATGIEFATATGGSSGRELLTAARTYYVRTDGNDANTGLTNTSGGAFLTIQKAVNVATGSIDASIYQVTIQIADGTYTTGATLYGMVGILPLIIRGNLATPSNVHIDVTGTCFFAADASAYTQLLDMKLSATSLCISCSRFGFVEFGNIVFGTAGARHVNAQYHGHINAIGNYSIVGGAPNHIYADNNATVRCIGLTVTLTGTPNFANSYVGVNGCSMVAISTMTFTGSATGVRHYVTTNGVLLASGVTLPGNSAGSTATGGQYV